MEMENNQDLKDVNIKLWPHHERYFKFHSWVIWAKGKQPGDLWQTYWHPSYIPLFFPEYLGMGRVIRLPCEQKWDVSPPDWNKDKCSIFFHSWWQPWPQVTLSPGYCKLYRETLVASNSVWIGLQPKHWNFPTEIYHNKIWPIHALVYIRHWKKNHKHQKKHWSYWFQIYKSTILFYFIYVIHIHS